MKRILTSFRISLFLVFGICLVPADKASATQPDTTPTPSIAGKKLRVGVYINQPFGYKGKEDYEGFCVNLWKEIAADLGLPFEYLPFPVLAELVQATSEGKVDVGLGNISITGERLKKVDFTHPYLQGGLQVMVNEKKESDTFRRLWQGLRDSGHLKIFTIALGIILLSTILLTFGERHWNKEFPADWPNGLSESFYHVMSITMTGKSSHKGLPGPFGKILAAIWLAFGVGVVAYITSSVTSVMTVNRLHGVINGPQDLPGHRVGTVTGTLSQQYCQEQNLNTTLYANLPDAVKALVKKDIDAIVFDGLTLQWYDNAHPELPITEVGSLFMKKGYGFALPIGNALRHDINRSLLKQQESGFEETLRKQYFGNIE